jgi:hypothetical protein
MPMTIKRSIIQTWLCLSAILFLCAQEQASAFYSPDTGRWLNRDPIGGNGGINLYRFVADNPINRIDPLGFATYLYLYGQDSSGLNLQRSAEWLEKSTYMKPGDVAVIAPVSGFDDINAQLKANQDIAEISYVGHGNPGILFVGIGTDPDTNITDKGGDYSIYGITFHSKSLHDLDFSNLNPNAQIHLYSCFSSRRNGDINSIRDSFAEAFPGVTVWGGYFGTKFYPTGQPYTFFDYVSVTFRKN